MRLRVNYRVEDDGKSSVMYQAIVRLIQSTGDVPRYIPEAVATQSIESLAQRWFVLNVGGEESDDNAVLCGDERETLAQRSLASLESRSTLSSRDPVALAAVIQRIKRACSFATQAAYYEAMFQFQHEEVEDAARAAPRPIGARPDALPLVPPNVADYMNNV